MAFVVKLQVSTYFRGLNIVYIPMRIKAVPRKLRKNNKNKQTNN